MIAGRVSKTLRRDSLRPHSPQRDHHARPNSRHRLRRPASGIQGAPRRRDGGRPSVLRRCRSGAGSPRGARNSSSAAGSAASRFLPGVSIDTGPGPSAAAGPTASPLAVRWGCNALVGAVDLRPGRRRRVARWRGGASADVCPRPQRSRRLCGPPRGCGHRHCSPLAPLVRWRQRLDHDAHAAVRNGHDAAVGRADDAHHLLGRSHLARRTRFPGGTVDGGAAELGPRRNLLGCVWPRHLRDGDRDGDQCDPPGPWRDPRRIPGIGLPHRCHAAAGGPVRSRQRRRNQLALPAHGSPRVSPARPSARLHVAGWLPLLRTPGRALADVDVVDTSAVVDWRQSIAPLGGDQQQPLRRSGGGQGRLADRAADPPLGRPEVHDRGQRDHEHHRTDHDQWLWGHLRRRAASERPFDARCLLLAGERR